MTEQLIPVDRLHLVIDGEPVLWRQRCRRGGLGTITTLAEGNTYRVFVERGEIERRFGRIDPARLVAALATVQP